jgi:hypothetical protein
MHLTSNREVNVTVQFDPMKDCVSVPKSFRKFQFQTFAIGLRHILICLYAYFICLRTRAYIWKLYFDSIETISNVYSRLKTYKGREELVAIYISGRWHTFWNWTLTTLRWFQFQTVAHVLYMVCLFTPNTINTHLRCEGL